MNLSLSFGRRSGADVVGLDIQPGFVAAVQARVNGSILAERAAVLPLAADTVRDGEVADESALSDVLRELFAGSGMGKRVRVGVANQRTVLRTLELPPLTDQKELAGDVDLRGVDQAGRELAGGGEHRPDQGTLIDHPPSRAVAGNGPCQLSVVITMRPRFHNGGPEPQAGSRRTGRGVASK